mmetsp:Transcript_20161/g.60830  ORF Transcript_20161/g.60830 Transcript_20161/m.60830 type:complete len:125 (-) Transcript_20161:590-964(-)
MGTDAATCPRTKLLLRICSTGSFQVLSIKLRSQWWLCFCRWFDLVVVLTTDNTVLYGRLESRGYHQAKIQENVQCEIMHVSIEEARAAYKPDIVKFLSSNTLEDMSANIQTIQSLLADYDAETN